MSALGRRRRIAKGRSLVLELSDRKSATMALVVRKPLIFCVCVEGQYNSGRLDILLSSPNSRSKKSVCFAMPSRGKAGVLFEMTRSFFAFTGKQRLVAIRANYIHSNIPGV